MKTTRRMTRMARNNKEVPKMSLTSLMDVFTILVFFLLVNSGSSEVLEAPKNVTLPSSIVETKPKETVIITVSSEQVIIQGEAIVSVADVLNSKTDLIPNISNTLNSLSNNVIGISTKAITQSKEVTILSDKTVPFRVLKKIMSSCTYAGFEKISMAVIQKASQSQGQS